MFIEKGLDSHMMPEFENFQIRSQTAPMLKANELNSVVLENRTGDVLGEVELLGSHYLALQYKGKIGYILSFDGNEGYVKVNQMFRVGKTGTRLGHSLDCLGYCLEFLRKNYIQKGIRVKVEDIEKIGDDPQFNTRYDQLSKYRILGKHLKQFCREHGLSEG